MLLNVTNRNGDDLWVVTSLLRGEEVQGPLPQGVIQNIIRVLLDFVGCRVSRTPCGRRWYFVLAARWSFYSPCANTQHFAGVR